MHRESPAAAVTVERDYSRKWFVMSAVAMGIFLATIDGSIVNVALPTLTTYLNTEFAIVQWVVLAYLLTVTTLLPVVGRLADMYGRKQLYVPGFIVFTIGSLLCGLSPTVGWLIAMRVLQGVGAALILALGLAIVTDAFPPGERGRALGVTGTIVSIGIVTGPTLGGIIIANLSWHWIFFVNVPIGILGVYLTLRHVPRARPPGNQRFDLAGAATLCLALLGILLSLTTAQERGFTDRTAIMQFVFGVFFLVAFVTIQRRHPQPIIDLELFRNPVFTVNLATGLLVFIGQGSAILIPFYLENVLGYGVQQVGLLLVVLPLTMGVVAPISGTLSDRLGSRPITVAGLAVIALGYVALATLSTETTAVGFMWRYARIGVGIGLFNSPNNSATMGTAPPNRLGVASALMSLTRSMGQTMGLALLGALWAGVVFRAVGGILPGGATTAPAEAQADALRVVMLVIAGMDVLALALALVAWRGERGRPVLPRAELEQETIQIGH